MLCEKGINKLPNENMLDWSKFKAFADDIIINKIGLKN